ncbi:arylsulfatase G-like [Sycon ciliatum]|uniref:arylsulfatase G-like n=1 Tax=Sycon ciliatum TaxID=27933 RepID=UPI0031F69898
MCAMVGSFLLYALVAATSVCSGNSNAAARPNVIFILADDWGWGDVGVYNPDHPFIRTPYLDVLASQGMLFTDFHVANPVCSPSRTAFMTGQFPSTLGIFNYLRSSHAANHGDGMPDFLNASTPTITRLLQQAGYRTGHFGKWHLGSTPDAPPPTAYGINESATYTSTDPNRLDGCADPGSIKVCPDVHWSGKSSGLIVDRGIEFIGNASKDQVPFYLNLWLHVSHAPLQLLPDQFAHYPLNRTCRLEDPDVYTHCPEQVFRAAQHDADAQIGRLMSALDQMKLVANTLVIFSADNGPEDPNIYFNSVGSAGPFRGQKRSIYEGGHRVPFIARYPGVIPTNRTSHVLMSSVDFLPTIAAFTGTPLDSSVVGHLVGMDMTSVLKGGPAAERKVNLKWDWRFSVIGNCWNMAPRLAIRQGDWKLLMNADGSRVELYNMTEVHFEDIDHSSRQPDVVKALSTELLSWVATQPTGPVSAHPGCAMHVTP